MTPRRAHKVREPKGAAPPAGRSLLVVHAAELLTLRGPPGARTRGAASELGILEDGAVYVVDGRIVKVGVTAEVLRDHPRAARTIDASGRTVLPGFVDAHTHAVFAGSREGEVDWKAEGLGYAEIADRGGGILHTVGATRAASEDELVRDAAGRLRAMAAHGTTTAEVKSGYGLTTADELKILRAAERAGELAGVRVVRTFLGAHAVPPEYAGRPDAYVDAIVSEGLDAVASARAASFCDVFVERGYFSTEQARRILEAAIVRGLGAKVHADELSDTGGAALAADVGAVSADHLIHVSDAGVEGMARAGVLATLLPATSLASRMPFADGRRLVQAGVPVALGTDLSPATWCESMQLVLALARHHNGLLAAQAIVAGTINAAHAVGRGDEVGSLEPGKIADLVVLDLPSHRHVGYRMGGNAVVHVVRGGNVAASRESTM